MKKLVLTLTVLALAVTTLVAAPFNLSGRFEGGYALTVDKDGNTTYSSKRDAEGNARIAALSLSDENNLWTLGLRLGKDSVTNGDTYNWGADLTVNLTNVFATKDIKLPVDLSYKIGRNASTTLTSVYKDSNSSYDGGTGIESKYSSKVAIAYNKLVALEVIGDPLTKTIGVGANSTPVDGVKVSAAYLHNAKSAFGVTGINNIISLATDVNVAKLAKLDFDLGVSAYTDILLKKDTDAKIGVLAEVYGGYKAISGYVEYKNFDSVNWMKASVSYKVIDDLTLSAAYTLGDFSKADTTSKISAGAVYKLGGVEYHVEPAYTFKGDFTLPVYVRLNF